MWVKLCGHTVDCTDIYVHILCEATQSMLIINHCCFRFWLMIFTEKGLCLSLSWPFREIYLWIRLEVDATSKSCYIKYTFLAHLLCRYKKTWLSHNLFPCIGLWASCIIWCENQRTVRTLSFYQMVSWMMVDGIPNLVLKFFA